REAERREEGEAGAVPGDAAAGGIERQDQPPEAEGERADGAPARPLAADRPARRRGGGRGGGEDGGGERPRGGLERLEGGEAVGREQHPETQRDRALARRETGWRAARREERAEHRGGEGNARRIGRERVDAVIVGKPRQGRAGGKVAGDEEHRGDPERGSPD